MNPLSVRTPKAALAQRASSRWRLIRQDSQLAALRLWQEDRSRSILRIMTGPSHPDRSYSRAEISGSVSEFLLKTLHVSFDSFPPRFKLLPERVLEHLFAILNDDRN